MTSGPSHALKQLVALEKTFGGGVAETKLELLRQLEKAKLASSKHVARLHEVLCFLRAHPDDARVLARVEAMLVAFAKRADVRRFRSELADSGIAGTDLYYAYMAPTARWLARRFPGQLHVDWSWFEGGELLEQRLPWIALYAETPGLDEVAMPMRKWIARLKGPSETDAEFLIESFARCGGGELVRDALYDELGLTVRLAAGAATPSRTTAVLDGTPVHFQVGPLRRERPDLHRELLTPPLSVRAVSEREGARIVDLAREAMVVRSRDLDAFMHGDPRDVRRIDCGGGLEFACIGVKPERRLLLEAVYAYLTLMNGVPIGYVLVSALMRSSEIAYNVFDTWRGGEAGHVYARVLATTRHLFGSDTFTVYPYQLGGDGNTEGLKSGAWWFYQKLGFRARDENVLSFMRRELAAMQRDTRHRSDIATLRHLAQHNVFYSMRAERDDIIGVFPLSDVGLAVTDSIAQRFGSDRERGERVCADEAARLCGARTWRTWPAAEKLAWRRWAPLILCLREVERWSAPQRAALVRVVRAKGGRRESDFVNAFDSHRELRRALRRLVAPR